MWAVTSEKKGRTNTVLARGSASGPKRPVLLLYDGHASHISLELIDYAILHEVIVVCLPAHSSHLLQPLDVAVFKSFKVFFSSACSRSYIIILER